MTGSGNHDQFRLGFLTAVEDPERGFIGGILITNRFGRPLEFQCTAPVKANRTQQILYGPTLRPFLLAELIGKTLVEKVAVKPHLVLADMAELLELREHIHTPVATFLRGKDVDRGLRLGNQSLEFHAGHAADRASIEKHRAEIPDSADLQEPFDRIREALSETLKSATRAA